MITTLPTQTLTYKRKSGGAYLKGRWAGDSTVSDTLEASVQPVPGKKILLIPEGRRDNDSWFLITDTELQTVESQNPDLVTISGEDFEVVHQKKWSNDIIPHYETIVVKP